MTRSAHRIALWRADEHEPITADDWAGDVVSRARDEIVADAERSVDDGLWPAHPRDEPEPRPWTTLYLGSAGMVWGLHELGSRLDLGPIIERALSHYRAAPDFADQAHPPSFWCGEAGLLAVAERIGSPAADTERLAALVRENRDHRTWELMWGSPGTMLVARALGLEAEWRDSAQVLWEQWDQDTDLWTQTLYGRVGHVLGPAHGFAGNVHALRGFVEDDQLRLRVGRLLERTALSDGGLVNWPPAASPPDRPDFSIRVQWCHGAPGIVATLGDLMPVELAVSAGELIWRAGPLRKGAGLCHGTAGNGYAFLRLFELTADERWLGRARRFAMHAIGQVRAQREHAGHGRYSLWTGDLGVALYLKACVDGDPAFPTIDRL